jgi:hypothetical protein
MAHFGPLPGHAAGGWDATQHRQRLTVGKHVEIGLYGGGYAGRSGSADLEVWAVDPLIATVHDAPRPSTPGWRRLVLLALKDGKTEIRATVPGTGASWASMRIEARVIRKRASCFTRASDGPRWRS